MAYTTLSIGSAGEEVKQLQQRLIEKNYLGAGEDDGIYGSKTAKAVKDYQTANSLQVDGIAGNETLGHLYSTAQNASGTTAAASGTTAAASGTAAAGETTVAQTTTPTADTGSYTEAVAQAKALLEEQLARKPGDYNDEWKQQAQGILEAYTSRDAFSYDVNEDALYQQLQDQYIQSGRLAMMDTMGQAAALTGGYGSSYGQTVGQQAYQSYLTQLTDKIPELYQLAKENYDAEGQALLEQFALVNEMDDQEYSRYMDELNTWLTEVDYLTGRLDTAQSYAYQAEQDAIAQDQWERTFGAQEKDTAYDRLASLISTTGYSPSQEELTAAGMSAGEAAAYSKYYSDQSTAAYTGGEGKSAEETGIAISDDVIDRCEELFGDDEAIDRHLSAKVRQGALTEDDAFYLLKVYCSDEYLKENYPGMIDTGVQIPATSSTDGGSNHKLTTTVSMLR